MPPRFDSVLSFGQGRILPAYPVPGRADADGDGLPPSPGSYCAWAPGSPARELPKSASTGEARRFRRLRDLLGGGKEKFLFLQPGGGDPASRTADDGNKQQRQEKRLSGAAGGSRQHPKQQGKRKKAAAEMDMAAALPGADRKHHSSYLPYRGFFASAHHPY